MSFKKLFTNLSDLGQDQIDSDIDISRGSIWLRYRAVYMIVASVIFVLGYIGANIWLNADRVDTIYAELSSGAVSGYPSDLIISYTGGRLVSNQTGIISLYTGFANQYDALVTIDLSSGAESRVSEYDSMIIVNPHTIYLKQDNRETKSFQVSDAMSGYNSTGLIIDQKFVQDLSIKGGDWLNQNIDWMGWYIGFFVLVVALLYVLFVSLFLIIWNAIYIAIASAIGYIFARPYISYERFYSLVSYYFFIPYVLLAVLAWIVPSVHTMVKLIVILVLVYIVYSKIPKTPKKETVDKF